jgi:hypothetical protein
MRALHCGWPGLFKASGVSGKVILFALAQLGTLPHLRLEWHVVHIHSVSLILLRPVIQK